jgi:tetratricopeptide (TPR) repeat protein
VDELAFARGRERRDPRARAARVPLGAPGAVLGTVGEAFVGAVGILAGRGQDGQLEAALAAYLAALKLDPTHARTRSNLGHLYLDLGRIEPARAELAALRELGSEFAARLEERLGKLENP